MATKVPRKAQLQLPKFVFRFNHDKGSIEDQNNIERIFSEKSVNSQELEETPQKKKRITKRSSGKMSNAARWSNDLILPETNMRPGPAFWTFSRATAGELSSTITNFFGCLTMVIVDDS